MECSNYKFHFIYLFAAAFEKEQMKQLEATSSSENELLHSDLSQDGHSLCGSGQSPGQGYRSRSGTDSINSPCCSRCSDNVDISSFVTDFMTKNHGET